MRGDFARTLCVCAQFHPQTVTFFRTERCTFTPLCGAVGSHRLALSPNPAAAVAADLLPTTGSTN